MNRVATIGFPMGVAQFLHMGNDGYTITNHQLKSELWLRDSQSSLGKRIVAARFIAHNINQNKTLILEING